MYKSMMIAAFGLIALSTSAIASTGETSKRIEPTHREWMLGMSGVASDNTTAKSTSSKTEGVQVAICRFACH